MLGIITGLKAEAELARYFFPDAVIAMSYSNHQGALNAIAYLKEQKVSYILSFGCAGALTSEVKVGDILIPHFVIVENEKIETSKSLPWDMSKAKSLPFPILAVDEVIATAEEKALLCQKTGAFCVDMESGVAAKSGLPFSVLRVICDDVTQTLPPAALVPLKKNGSPSVRLILGSIKKEPSQILALIKLGKTAFFARIAMKKYLEKVLY